MDPNRRNLALDAVRITECAALAAHIHMGHGDEQQADQAALNAMAETLSGLPVNGRVAIGEQNTDTESVLAVGQQVGDGSGSEMDVALMPLEGSSIVARGGFNALSALAFAEESRFLSVPPVYMNKIAVGSGLKPDVVHIDSTPKENISRLSEALGIPTRDLVVCILDRPRHKDMIADARSTGARIRLIMDGDLSGAVAPARANSGIDLFMGIGLAPQGVLSAAALRCAGGQFQGRLMARNASDREMISRAGIENTDKVYTLDDMVPAHVTFAATGITSGPLLNGVERSRFRKDGYTYTTHSMVLRSATRSWRMIQTHHHDRGTPMETP